MIVQIRCCSPSKKKKKKKSLLILDYFVNSAVALSIQHSRFVNIHRSDQPPISFLALVHSQYRGVVNQHSLVDVRLKRNDCPDQYSSVSADELACNRIWESIFCVRAKALTQIHLIDRENEFILCNVTASNVTAGKTLPTNVCRD